MATKSNLPAWRPRELFGLQRGIDRLFGELLEPWGGSFLEMREPEFEFSPLCDVEETDKEFLLSFDLPGVTKEDLKIELQDNQLTLSGERKKELTEEKGARRITERSYGSFSRSFTLPVSVDAAKVKAAYRDGVLEISIPKKPEAASKQIPISEGKVAITKKVA